MQHILVVNISY